MTTASRTAFEAFEHEVGVIRAAWAYFSELDQVEGLTPEEARDKNERIRRTAPGFFQHARWGILSTVVLGLSRLGDPKYSMGDPNKANLTVDRIYGDLPDSPVARSVGMAREAFHNLVRSAEFVKLRSKVFAHNDLEIALGEVDPPAIDVDVFHEAVGHLLDFHSRAQVAIQGGPFPEDWSGYHESGVVSEPYRIEVRRLLARL